MGTTISSITPSSHACAALRWLSTANASASSFVRCGNASWRFSAVWPITAADSSTIRSETNRGLKSTSSPIGWWPMCSTPPTRTTSAAPIAISPAPLVVAVSAPAHMRSTAKPGHGLGETGEQRDVAAERQALVSDLGGRGEDDVVDPILRAGSDSGAGARARPSPPCRPRASSRSSRPCPRGRTPCGRRRRRPPHGGCEPSRRRYFAGHESTGRNEQRARSSATTTARRGCPKTRTSGSGSSRAWETRPGRQGCRCSWPAATRRGAAWLVRAAERYRESWPNAPAGSWGRPIGAMKSRLIAGDREGALEDARWALDAGAAESESPIGRYAAALAHLVRGEDAEAARVGGDARRSRRLPGRGRRHARCAVGRRSPMRTRRRSRRCSTTSRRGRSSSRTFLSPTPCSRSRRSRAGAG